MACSGSHTASTEACIAIFRTVFRDSRLLTSCNTCRYYQQQQILDSHTVGKIEFQFLRIETYHHSLTAPVHPYRPCPPSERRSGFGPMGRRPEGFRWIFRRFSRCPTRLYCLVRRGGAPKETAEKTRNPSGRLLVDNRMALLYKIVEYIAFRCMPLNRESRENRERSRRCDPVSVPLPTKATVRK